MITDRVCFSCGWQSILLNRLELKKIIDKEKTKEEILFILIKSQFIMYIFYFIELDFG